MPNYSLSQSGRPSLAQPAGLSFLARPVATSPFAGSFHSSGQLSNARPQVPLASTPSPPGASFASPTPGSLSFSAGSFPSHSRPVFGPERENAQNRSSQPPSPPALQFPRPASSRPSYAPPYSLERTFEEDVGNFRLSGTFAALIPQWSPETKEQDERVRRQYIAYCLEKLRVRTLDPPVFGNLSILAFLTSKIEKAKAAIVAGLESPLSGVSLSDRYIASLRRLQLVEQNGLPDVAAFEEVKREVMSRAKNAELPLVSKGTCALYPSICLFGSTRQHQSPTQTFSLPKLFYDKPFSCKTFLS
jgi:hypothetical protein